MKLGNLRRRPATTNAEEGYFLMVIMLMVAVLAIASLSRAQSMVTELKREREEELVHRGVQYARAIKKYYKWSRGQYPATLDQLEKTNNMRFLRKRYKDPVTGGDFRLIRLTDLNSVLNPQNPLSGTSNSDTGNSTSNSSSNGNLNGAAANSVLNAVGLGGGTASGTSLNANTGQNSNNSQSTAGQSIGSGPTFGGGPFIGVASTSSKVSLMEFDKKNHYKDWLFIYVPQMDVVASATGMTPPLIKGPFVKSQLTGGVGGQNQPLFPNQPNQPNVTPMNNLQPNPAGTPFNQGAQPNQ
jgi:type II secretory pathway pseudopilin PulG